MAELVTLEGFSELDEALGELPRATARNILYKALFLAAEPIDDAWRAEAPFLTGHLKDSGGVTKAGAADFNKAYSATLSAGGDQASAVAAGREAQSSSDRAFAEIVVGPGRNPQAIMQEFGTHDNHAQPFLTPAWEGNKTKALDTIKEFLTIEIAKAAARMARKAARLIAKSGG